MIAVTTHSRTRSLRYTVPMLLAGKRIERDLRGAPGCDRYTNVIAGLREFWTLTVWRDAADMRDWMRAGSHGRIMWLQPRWLECYWGMRWRPGSATGGVWEGDAWRLSGEAALDSALGRSANALPAIPWMRGALGHTVSVERRQLAGVTGATYRLRVPPWRLPSAIDDLRRLRGILASDPDSFAVSLGLGTGAALYLMLIAMSQEALDRLQAAAEHRRFIARWGDRAWWSTWQPESEFGQWQGHRLREGQLSRAPILMDVSLPARSSSPQRARHAVRTYLRACLQHLPSPDAELERVLGNTLQTDTDRRLGLRSLDRTSVEVLELLVSELVANSVRHAGLGPTDSIGLRLRAEADWVRVEVVDRGRRFEPRVLLTRPSGEESGSGLYELDQMVERWGIVDRSPDRHLWFEMHLSPLTQRR